MSKKSPKSFEVIGNWKMNASLESISGWASSMKLWMQKNQLNSGKNPNLKISVCPPHPYLISFKENLAKSGVLLGAQEISEFTSGAHTGEVSAAMIKELECDYCIVGHSEARQNFKQTDGQISQKLSQLVKEGIIPILCVGESLKTREQGRAEDFVLAQLKNALEELEGKPRYLIIAYEPIWAIGIGKTASSKVADKMHQTIRALVSEKMNYQNFKIIYGGSVNQNNAKELFSMPNIDGVLVGGASLDARLFQQICGAGLCLTSY